MLSYSILNIAEITNATLLQQKNNASIENILLDSRRVLFPSTSIFFTLSGPRRTGADFIQDLYLKEVRNFVVDESFDNNDLLKFPEANFLKVKNVLATFQQLAAHHRNQFTFPVIGITGSNGKTIIKEWLFQLLNTRYNIVRSPKSYNSQIGVPLSVWQINQTHTLGIFEAGISQPEEMKNLQPIINPEIGILSYIGDAHAEGFENIHQKINEKLQLFTSSKVLIYCSENKLINECIDLFVNNANKKIQLFSWSRTATADLHISSIEINKETTCIHCVFKNEKFNFSIPFTDEASVYNAITCCATLLYMGLSKNDIAESTNEIRRVAMRLELKQGNNQCAIINDSYSADIDSLNIALDFLSQQDLHTKKTVILSDVLQSGIADDILYSQIAAILKQKNIHRFIGIGPNMMRNANSFNALSNKLFFLSTTDFIQSINEINFQDETILLKGARVFEFERINYIMEQKIHDTVLEINLNSLRNNLKTYRHQLNKNVKLMAMVKAFSYGSGSHEIAYLLQHEAIDYLAVAYTDEGVDLRKAGIRLPIMVMNTTETGFDNLLLYKLEPEIYSFNVLKAFRNYLKNRNITDYPIHIKLDTGMHRLGFMQDDIFELCELLKDEKVFKIKSAFSHLVASENAEQDDFTLHQASLFSSMALQIEKTTGYIFIKHLSNTSAIHRHAQLQFDMVRLGIGLYGVDEQLSLQNVTTLKTTIAQIKKLKKGDTVGYGRKGILLRDSTVATVRIGYADGYPRVLGNGAGKMMVNGTLAPVVGNICMDMTMLDITDVPAEEGDEVIVFGEQLSVKIISQLANTIPYEILTNISQRVKRVYYEE